jgi:hypothetical protein
MNADDIIIILQEETDRLREIKKKGKFNLLHAEYGLKRMAEKFATMLNEAKLLAS